MKGNRKWCVTATAWCLLIAMATRHTGFTGESTGQLLENPLINPDILNYIIRKLVHLAAFGLLAVFFWLALRGKRYQYILAWGLATAYGAIDEWHQTFVPGRDGVFSDVLINSAGALIALSFVYVIQAKMERK
ncbi:VanZ family protein [Thalassorhabdus alkalitolerans]|uniref:VanZ family protein n=2 Tax=Thalassorhabdus alkalitolerans TaxID=2282697 RepID=A0ABW0YJV3_9BACI